MTPMDRLIAAADALADAGKALRTWDGRPTADAKSEWDEAEATYRAAREAVGKPTPPAFATSA